MPVGRLFTADYKKERLLGEVMYRLQSETSNSWWGELVLVEYKALTDGSGYLIELEDKRRGKCSLKKRVNRAVSGVPPRYIYHFTGIGPLAGSKS
ncbi:MAG: hypothetical protein ABID87_09005 [Chloroflexota bacterium]